MDELHATPPWRSAGDRGGDRRAERLSLHILARLRERISNGDYPSKSRLPSEASLAAEFGVSRPVVREALACLQDDALITVRRGSGSYVRDQRSPAPETPPLSSLADLERCFEVRLVLEPRAAALAAERHLEPGQQAIKAALDRLRAAAAAQAEDSEADLAFHLAIATAGGNPYFGDMLAVLRVHIMFGMELTRRLGRLRPGGGAGQAIAEHEAIASAILARDPGTAERAMTAHLERTRRRVFGGEEQPGR